MASSSHVALRLAALALLVAVGLWPRSRPSHANANANANVARPVQERAHELVRTTTPHVLEGAARAVRRQAPAAEVLADADDSPLVN